MRRSHAPDARLRRFALLVAALAATVAACLPMVADGAPSKRELQQKIAAAQQRERALHGSVQAESGKIAGFQGSIDDLTARQHAVETTLAVERRQLETTQRQLREERVRLTTLKAKLATDMKQLAAQLVAQYKAPPDDIVTVVVDAKGFSGLIERMDDMKRLRTHNVAVTSDVLDARRAVAAETARLTGLEQRRQRIANASLVQRDQVARLRIAVVSEQMTFVRVRSRDAAKLHALQSTRSDLQGTLRKIQAREAAARAAPTSGSLGAPPPPPAGGGGTFSAHGGDTGFFQAAGTNYSVGSTPELAARLDQLGKALGLHLIGISGYRTPQHSVEVGGFANDPHTRGQASDTPGIEGVSEATLEQYGMTRPFGGAAEADHIQLLGSI
jgi:peptidoglycan hydrolase CwlO-like protein